MLQGAIFRVRRPPLLDQPTHTIAMLRESITCRAVWASEYVLCDATFRFTFLYIFFRLLFTPVMMMMTLSCIIESVCERFGAVNKRFFFLCCSCKHYERLKLFMVSGGYLNISVFVVILAKKTIDRMKGNNRVIVWTH